MSRASQVFGLTLLLGLVLGLNTCSRKNSKTHESPAPSTPISSSESVPVTQKTAFQIPMSAEDRLFAEQWKASLSASEGTFELRDASLDPKWKLNTETWLNEVGTLFRLALKPGAGTQEMRSWLRLLQDAQSLIEDPQLVLPLKPSLKLFSNLRVLPAPTTSVSMNRYIEVQTDPSASPLAKEACEVFRKWFSARQLMTGRNLKALSRTRETLTLNCSLDIWQETPPTMPYLQIAELPLPIVEPERQEVLFRYAADLLRADKIRTLQAMPTPSRQN